MGQTNDSKAEGKPAKRGATNNKSRLAGLGKASKPADKADWGEVDPAWIVALVVLLTKHSGAVRFGRSRDGNVLSVGVYLDGDAVTLWLDAADELEAQLARIYDDLAGRLGA